MKKIFQLFAITVSAFLVMSCNDREEGDLVQDVRTVKIDSVVIPQDTMSVFSVQTIKTYSSYAAQCEGFYGYDYLHTDPFTRTVASYRFKTDAPCGEEVARASQINFRPQQKGTYLFRFWNGKNASGQSQWIEKSITVD